MSLAPVLVLAIGNESRGDDALGPLLIRRIGEWLGHREEVFELLEEFQLQIEHTLDIKGRELVLFIDAGKNTAAPFTFYQAQGKRLDGHTTHAVAPETLLGIYAEVHGEAPPPAFVLCVAGRHFELGEPLSAGAERCLAQAFDFSRRLLARPVFDSWRSHAQDGLPLPQAGCARP